MHGGRIGFVFQNPGTSLNPLLTLERQITESVEAHRGLTRRQARARALELLEAVGLPDPADRLNNYPHQLSGGQRQRVMIAIALACDPGLLIADEPTTALDVTTQAQIIELVRQLQRDFGAAVVWVSHDLGVIGQVADSVTVLRNGEAVEQAPVLDVFDRPRQPYTRQLLEARPRINCDVVPPPAQDAPVLLTVRGLDVRYSVTRPGSTAIVHAVKDLSFEIRQATTLGLVGESGSGKSTVALALAGLAKPHAGTASLAGTDVFAIRGSDEAALRGRISLVWRDRLPPSTPARGWAPRSPSRCMSTGSRRDDANAESAWPICSRWSVCRPISRRDIHMSCPAASASGSASHGRSRCSPNYSSSTNRLPALMFRRKPAFWICFHSCSVTATSPTCSSRMIWPWYGG